MTTDDAIEHDNSDRLPTGEAPDLGQRPTKNALVRYLGGNSFGIPFPGVDGYTNEEYAEYRRQASFLAYELFQTFSILFGEEIARDRWVSIGKKPRGAPKGSRDPIKDDVILAVYDQWSKEEEPLSIDGCASLLNKYDPKNFGPSASSLATRMRRLLKAREKEANR